MNVPTQINDLIENGTSFMKQGNYKQAMVIFNDAFELSKEWLRQDSSDNDNEKVESTPATNNNDNNDNKDNPSNGCDNNDISATSTDISTKDHENHSIYMNNNNKSTTARHHHQLQQQQQTHYLSNPDMPFVYACAMRIPISDNHVENDNDYSTNSIENIKYYCAVVTTFNLALAQHLSVLDKQQQQQQNNAKLYSKRLTKAFRLYEIAFCLKVKHNIPLPIQQAIGLINNIAVLAKQMGKSTQSNRFFQMLLSSTMYYMDRLREADEYYNDNDYNYQPQMTMSCHHGRPKDKEALEGFTHNLILFVLIGQRVTAGAA